MSSDPLRHQLLRFDLLLDHLAAARADAMARFSDDWLLEVVEALAEGRRPTVELPADFARRLELLAVPSLILELRRRAEVADLEAGE